MVALLTIYCCTPARGNPHRFYGPLEWYRVHPSHRHRLEGERGEERKRVKEEGRGVEEGDGVRGVEKGIGRGVEERCGGRGVKERTGSG